MEERKTKFKFKVPHTYVLIISFIFIAVILTYLLPAGMYDTVKTDVSSKPAVDPSSYHYVESNPAGFDDFILSIPRGMLAGANTIFTVLLIGGFFAVINSTGAIDSAINSVTTRLKDRALWIIPGIMILMYVLGFMSIVVDASIAFIPIGIAVSKRLKLDPFVGVSMFYLPCFAGFATTPFGPWNSLLAQNVAGLEPLSGAGYRIVFSVLTLICTVVLVYRYAKKLQRDPSKSILGENPFRDAIDTYDEEINDFNWRYALVFIILIIGFIVYAWGSYTYFWGTEYLSGIMFFVALLCGLVTKINPDKMASTFVDGASRMTFGALVVGLAAGINIILTEGKVIHTIIYYFSLPLGKVPAVFSALGMFITNLIFNMFVPSGSGQAMVVMPIMAPLADIVGVTRQVAVSCYQYGDGMSNVIIPTSGTLMAILGLAGIRYEKWIKYIKPIFLSWIGVGAAAIIIGVIIGWA